MEDTIEITGLSVLLDEEFPRPFLDLTLRCNGQTFRAGILAVEDDWALHLKREDGERIPSDGEFYPTEAGAILAALLCVLEASHG
jgi:hypothetical protein